MMIIIASNDKIIPHLFLVFVIFIVALIALRSKNKSMSYILVLVQLINLYLTAKVACPDHIWLVFSQKHKMHHNSPPPPPSGGFGGCCTLNG